MRQIDADALKEAIRDIELSLTNKRTILGIIDNAPTVSDRYCEGYAQGYIDGSTGADWKGGAENG